VVHFESNVQAGPRSLCLPTPAARIPLPAGEIHVWVADLDQLAPEVRRLASALSADEAARAARFHFERDRKRFVVGRGFLREVLAGYCGVDPGRLEFEYSAHGKPSLSGDAGGDGLRFNLSHSHGLALCAVTRDREIGVDIELIRAVEDLDELAASVFSAQERQVLRSLRPDEQLSAFFRCWTRKEAIVKALGQGLSYPLANFDVAFAPGEPARLLRIENSPGESEHFSLHEVPIDRSHVAAIAVEGAIERLVCGAWVGHKRRLHEGPGVDSCVP
jgi:4'-phosphopantetheinyl transferase